MTALLTVLIYAVISLSFGLRLTRLLAPRIDFSKVNQSVAILCTSFLLGQGVLAAIWQLVALIGQFTIPAVMLVGFLGLISGITLLPRSIGQFVSNVYHEMSSWRQQPILWKIVIVLAVMTLCITAIYTFAPPMPRGDALAFYMAYPRLIAATGHLDVFPPGYANFAQVGLQGEMHYAVLMLFGNMSGSDLFTLLTIVAGIGLLTSLANTAGVEIRGKWIIFVCAITSSAVTIIIWDGKVDIYGASMGLAAYYWAFHVHNENTEEVSNHALLLSGLFTGFGIIAKISYAVFLPITVAMIIFWRLYLNARDSIQTQQIILKIVRIGMILAFWGALPAIPHIIKNTVLFGEPLAPLVAQDNESLLEQRWFNADTTYRIVATYPFSLTFGNFWGQGGQISPIILVFSPFLLLLFSLDRTKRRLIVQISLVAIIAVSLWIIFRASVFAPRYMLTPLMLVFVPVAFVAENVSLQTVRRELAVIIPVVLIIVMGVVLFNNELFSRFSLNLMLDRVDTCAYEYTNQDGSCRVAQVVNAQADEGSRIINLSYYSYWLRPDLLQCATEKLGVPDDYTWDHIRMHQVDYIIVDTLTHKPEYEQLIHNIPDGIVLEIFFDDSSYLGMHIVSDRNDEGGELYSCIDQGSNIWENEVDFSASVEGQSPENPHDFRVNDSILSWEASSRAEWYQIWVLPVNLEVIPLLEWHSASELNCNRAETCVYETHLPSGDYQWYVRAWGSTGLNSGGTQGWITAPAFNLPVNYDTIESEG
ncbi:MAG: hypothetical protein RLP44_21580 [Aggregatilineales bacterium]